MNKILKNDHFLYHTKIRSFYFFSMKWHRRKHTKKWPDFSMISTSPYSAIKTAFFKSKPPIYKSIYKYFRKALYSLGFWFYRNYFDKNRGTKIRSLFRCIKKVAVWIQKNVRILVSNFIEFRLLFCMYMHLKISNYFVICLKLIQYIHILLFLSTLVLYVLYHY